MPIPAFVTPLVMGVGSLLGGAMGGKGGKGGGGASYPPELNNLLRLQYDTTKQFQPMISEWAKMGNAYMGIPGGGSASSNVSWPSGWEGAIDKWSGYGEDGTTGGGRSPTIGGAPPMELENMPALRDLLYQPGGVNELMYRRQGETSRGQILESLPQGGVMQDALASQRRYENENLAAMRIGARQDAAKMVLSGGPMVTPFSQLGGSTANTAMGAANAYGQQQAAKASGLGGLGQMVGTATGSYFSSAGGGGKGGGGKGATPAPSGGVPGYSIGA